MKTSNLYHKLFYVLVFILLSHISVRAQFKLIVIDEDKPITSSTRPNVPPKPIPFSFDLIITNQEAGYISIEYSTAKNKDKVVKKVFSLASNDTLRLNGLHDVKYWHYLSPNERCTYSNDHKFPVPKEDKVIDKLHIDVSSSDITLCQENARIYDAFTSNDSFVKMHQINKDGETIYEFEAAKYEVSLEQYMLFVNQTDYKPKENKYETKHINPKNGAETADKYSLDYRYGPNGEKRNIEIGHLDRLQPVIYVNRSDILAFLKWINDRDKIYHYRLPTKNEWEYLAMGKSDKTNKYPWGNNNKITDQYANTCDASLKDLLMLDPKRLNQDINDEAKWTWSVNTGRPNMNGIYNVIGNVAEWTDTPLENNKKVENKSKESKYIFKGGSYFANINDISAWATNDAFDESMRHPGVGFRLIRSKRQMMK
jgi:formylglycine-generating enzyme required for sulfatase activity